MNKIYNSIRSLFAISLFGTVLMFSACSEDMPMNPDSTYARLVVEGYLTTDTMQHKVRLTRSGDALFKDSVQSVSNAIVSITDGTNVFNLTEDPANKGIYLTAANVYGVPGRTYTLNIKNVDINSDGTTEEYSAQSILHAENPIDSIKVVYDKTNINNKGWLVNLYALEAGGGRNFYLLRVLRNKVMITDSIFKYGFTDNTGFGGKYFDGFSVYRLLEENVNERIFKGDTITLEMDGITEDYYHFLYDYVQEYEPKIPIFSGPSANISTNIVPKDKAIGVFAAYSVRRKSVVY
jgi:hypothetical protein